MTSPPISDGVAEAAATHAMTSTAAHSDICRAFAQALIDIHQRGGSEADVVSAVRDFLTHCGLVDGSGARQGARPSDTAAGRVDLVAGGVFFEVKQRVSAAGFPPDHGHVEQLRGYLTDAAAAGKPRRGVLTDGKYWLRVWPGMGQPSSDPQSWFELEEGGQGVGLFDWLRDVLDEPVSDSPTAEGLLRSFGPGAVGYREAVDGLTVLYESSVANPTVRVKRDLWENLLQVALGELVEHGDNGASLLFVRHTYLGAAISLILQTAFGINVEAVAGTDPAALLSGDRFRTQSGVAGVIESDFFGWPAEVEGGAVWLRALAERVGRFGWSDPPSNVASMLYETVIPQAERERLREYYTPDWLARRVVRRVVDDPLNQTVLDPACGSGAFLTESVTHFIERADTVGMAPTEALQRLVRQVVGVDIHPAAVHLSPRRVGSRCPSADPGGERRRLHGYGDGARLPG